MRRVRVTTAAFIKQRALYILRVLVALVIQIATRKLLHRTVQTGLHRSVCTLLFLKRDFSCLSDDLVIFLHAVSRLQDVLQISDDTCAATKHQSRD
jgi:hypothetical protein